MGELLLLVNMIGALFSEGGGRGQILQGSEGGLRMRGRKVGCIWLVSGHLHFTLHLIERKEKEMSETESLYRFMQQ